VSVTFEKVRLSKTSLHVIFQIRDYEDWTRFQFRKGLKIWGLVI
jgi:hypothetical protein